MLGFISNTNQEKQILLTQLEYMKGRCHQLEDDMDKLLAAFKPRKKKSSRLRAGRA